MRHLDRREVGDIAAFSAVQGPLTGTGKSHRLPRWPDDAARPLLSALRETPRASGFGL